MSMPFTLPEWVPWWVPIAVLVPALLYTLVFLFMPFSVIGVRGRLESIDARLDEIQGEIRSLALRLPETLPISEYDEPPPLRRPAPRPEYQSPSDRPPIPPAPYYPETIVPRPTPARTSRPRGVEQRGAEQRPEPRLDWPR